MKTFLSLSQTTNFTLPKWKSFADGNSKLTHYQTANFRLFQTERVCRRQFQIWHKRQKVIQTGRKHWRKRRNCRYEQFLRLPQCFQKVCFPGMSKGVIVWEWVKWRWHKVLQMGRKHFGKMRNCSLWAIPPFPTVFFKRLVKTRACLGKG